LWEPAGKIGSHKFRVRENAVVFSLLNPRIPRFALVLGGDDVVCSTEFAVMQPTDLIHETFLLLLASSNIFQKVVGSLASGTTKSRERVKPSDLEGVSISLPPIEEQIRIVEIVSSMDEVIQTTEKAMAEAKNLRSGLLSELLSGEHEIPASYDSMLGAA
jgi:type I restriction enzyme S subunit